jgi:hypothetical protein
VVLQILPFLGPWSSDILIFFWIYMFQGIGGDSARKKNCYTGPFVDVMSMRLATLWLLPIYRMLIGYTNSSVAYPYISPPPMSLGKLTHQCWLNSSSIFWWKLFYYMIIHGQWYILTISSIHYTIWLKVIVTTILRISTDICLSIWLIFVCESYDIEILPTKWHN